MGNVNNIKITPVNVFWQMNHIDSFDFTGKTATGLAGKYVQVYPANAGVGHYAWFNTGSDTDPSVVGQTAIAVSILTTDTPAQIATKFATAVTAATGAGYKAAAAGAVATVKRTAVGTTLLSVDGASTKATGAVITMVRRGRDYDLGLLQGDVELSFEPSNYNVTSHQTGVTPRAAIFQGFKTLDCSTNLQETSAAQLQALYDLYGGSYTPDGGTKIYGVGSAAQGKNLLSEAGRLVLKPVNAVDNSENFNMMLAVPVPGKLQFSGENPRTLSVTWQGFVDQDANPVANAIAVGDIFQAGL